MAEVNHTETFNCTPQQFFDLLKDYDSYPKFLKEVRSGIGFSYIWSMDIHEIRRELAGKVKAGDQVIDELAEQATVTIDLDERAEILHEMQHMLAEDVPAIVFFYPDGNYAFRTDGYDGWVVEAGHGAFTKRSFLP